jgi:hypothetical protein
MIERRLNSKRASYLARAISASIITVACLPRESGAQADAPGRPGHRVQIQATDREKCTGLESRAAALRQRIEELKREDRRIEDDAEHTSAVLRVANPADRNRLEVRLREIGDEKVRAVTERWRALDSLRTIDDRLRKLRRLVALDLEISKLKEAERDETKSLRKLESEWEALRSRVSKAIVAAAVSQAALKLEANPSSAIGDVSRSLGEELGLDANKFNKFVQPSDAELKRVVETATKHEKEAETARAEARRHLDRESAVKMKIAEVQGRLEFSTMMLKVLEENRHDWDHD